VRSGGGSPQANRDRALSIRINQGFVAQEGIISARLAQNGLTGARNFLQGELGYFHLFSQDDYDPKSVSGDLGTRFEFLKTMFKAYPSCGSTISGIEAVLYLLKEHPDITPENIRKVKVKLTPYAARIVDSPFVMGETPRVNAQYNVRYSIANALLRKDCRIEHYEEAYARDPQMAELLAKIDIVGDAALEKRDETAVDIEVITKSGQTYIKGIDTALGFPPRYLTNEQKMYRFLCNINYGDKHLPEGNVDKIIAFANDLEEVKDVRDIVPLLLWKPESKK
jgi:2-methylcitrate dehydratase PrpD